MSEYIGGDYQGTLGVLEGRLREPLSARVQLLTGPRQVGKTTLLLEVAARLGPSVTYAACDDPQAAAPGFWERLWGDAEARATAERAGVLLIDEIQYLPDWGRRLKGQWDRVRRRRIPLHVVVSGSSALQIGRGARETMAGRFERLSLTHWSAKALSVAFALPPAEAALALVQTGSYPGAFPLRPDPARWRAYVRDAIVEPAIGRDLMALTPIRRPALLRQVFAVAVGMPAQIVSLQKLQGQLGDPGALETIAQYLSLLRDAYLVAPLEKFSDRVIRRRRAPPKLVTLNNALITAMHPDGAPDRQRDPERFGVWVENACLAWAWNAGQRVSYWREEPLEVDAVIDGSWGPWAVDVKTGRITLGDLSGLLEFCRRHPRYRPLVITADDRRVADLPVQSISWIDFLLSGPPRQGKPLGARS